MALGLLLGLALLAVIRLVIEPVLPAIGARIAAAGTLPLWRRVLIIYVAAVAEELVFRLLVLSLIAGVMTRILQGPAQVPNTTALWVANGLAALAFAAGHLPAWTSLGPLSPALATSILALNAGAALVIGHVFATRGVAAAIWTHAGADCAIQLIGPL